MKRMASQSRLKYRNIWPYVRLFTQANPWKIEDKVLKLFGAMSEPSPIKGVTMKDFPHTDEGKLTFRFSWVENKNNPQVHSLVLIGVVVGKRSWWSRFIGLSRLLADIKALDVIIDDQSVFSNEDQPLAIKGVD